MGMTEHEASRTLVKSPPELWAECSEAESLARHLADFGEIRITRLEPENAVAWEGTLASGTVRLEPSGWGTRVILTARKAQAQRSATASPDGAARAVAEPEAAPKTVVEPEASEPGPDTVAPAVTAPPPAPPRQPARRGGLIARLFGFLRPAPRPPSPAVVAPPAPRPAAATAPAATPPVAAAVPEPPPAPEAAAPVPEAAAPVPAPGPTPAVDPAAVLTAALDSLGQAHHRPFSRG